MVHATIVSQYISVRQEATLASGEENEMGEDMVMAVKRFFGWCNDLGCYFCGDWRSKATKMKMDEGESICNFADKTGEGGDDDFFLSILILKQWK